MKKLSIRTLLLLTMGAGMLITIFTRGASSANMFHTILVLAFAIPEQVGDTINQTPAADW